MMVGGVIALIGLVLLVMLCSDTVEPAVPPPSWAGIVHIDNSINTGFNGVSDGMRILDPNSVLRTRKGDYEADGARWGAPLKTGKHMFEIYWPRNTRRLLATVGVGTDIAPLFVKPKESLVGCNKHTWGLDIARYKCLHRNEIITSLPKNKVVPDTFRMYVDCESGTLGFGSEHVYWGAPINIPRSEFPVYPMVGTTQHNAVITMKYKGSALNTMGDTGYNLPMPVPIPGPVVGPLVPPGQVVVPPAPVVGPQGAGEKVQPGPSDSSETYIAPMRVSGI
ncbi:SPRY domain-containing SOCS box protein 2-like [Ruditapes philippinarum]|uniref:SPRY domain-containing SOCS box protein 2-like n=1 Tax=Ruditapes philippinarum TaxID=129788 RepID=UPI00295BA563|nr:SPRY domain-containing SOCS box protein 2-like [Ruditapes philippinarum]XP_060559290.1 SPRY domain-containing SOCS box protein 2-like [Ruditapes philippinarum]